MTFYLFSNKIKYMENYVIVNFEKTSHSFYGFRIFKKEDFELYLKCVDSYFSIFEEIRKNKKIDLYSVDVPVPISFALSRKEEFIFFIQQKDFLNCLSYSYFNEADLKTVQKALSLWEDNMGKGVFPGEKLFSRLKNIESYAKILEEHFVNKYEEIV